jgi:AcrR family transcriptional regulator
MALFEATVKPVNEIGFAASSVSKVAREANVSPSTLYVFFKNKEDLLVSTYVDIKLDLSRAMLGLPGSILSQILLHHFHDDHRRYRPASVQYAFMDKLCPVRNVAGHGNRQG